jgi:hypothetical protein
MLRVVDAAGRHDLTDEAWAVVGPLLPVVALVGWRL